MAKGETDMNWKQILRTLPVVAFGNALMAAGIVVFILPSGLISGGTTGLGIIMEHLTGLPIPVFSAIFIFSQPFRPLSQYWPDMMYLP